MKRVSFLLLSCLGLAALLCGQIAGDKPLLLHHPTISRTQIVFSFANDLWSVNRNGGDAVRLTTGVGGEIDPIFSPDGSQIAFTGEYDGNVDVFVMLPGCTASTGRLWRRSTSRIWPTSPAATT